MKCQPGIVQRATSVLLFALGFLVSASVVADPPRSVSYQYDDAGRLKTTTYNDGKAKTYTLDAAGNRTQTQLATGASVVQFSMATASASEGTSPFTITVTRTGSTTGAVTVNYATANGTAIAGSDYTATSGTLNWAIGDSADKSIPVPITDDAATEANETFTLTLSNPSGAGLGTSTATVTILANDPGSNTPTMMVGVSPADQNGFWAYGYCGSTCSSPYGAITPATTSNGFSYMTITDTWMTVDAGGFGVPAPIASSISLKVPSGVDPGQAYLTSVNVNGQTFTGASASYYGWDQATQTAGWSWVNSNYFGLANVAGQQLTVMIVHQ